jgi:hypothetical protein
MTDKTIEALKAGVVLSIFYEQEHDMLHVRGRLNNRSCEKLVSPADQRFGHFDLINMESEHVAMELLYQAEQAKAWAEGVVEKAKRDMGLA